MEWINRRLPFLSDFDNNDQRGTQSYNSQVCRPPRLSPQQPKLVALLRPRYISCSYFLDEVRGEIIEGKLEKLMEQGVKLYSRQPLASNVIILKPLSASPLPS
jgi:hypothetical protein